MAVYIARSECRDGLWHVVTYDITDPGNWEEVSIIPTEQPCEGDEEPVVIWKFGTPGTFVPGTEKTGEADCGSLRELSFSWVQDIDYAAVAPNEECPRPDPIQLARGLRAAREYFFEVAEQYCAESEEASCSEDHACRLVKSPPTIEIEEVVSRIEEYDEGEDLRRCYLKFRITGPVRCTCRRTE